MTRVRVASFAVSLDGFGAGPGQDLDHPLGVGGEALHAWAFETRTLQRRVFGRDAGAEGIDDDFAARGFENVGAWILGRNMFGPIRGPWPDESWRGWWGDEPPYHVPVFVLTHHARPPLTMAGGTTFHFVTGGIHEALQGARDAARGRGVRLGGGGAPRPPDRRGGGGGGRRARPGRAHRGRAPHDPPVPPGGARRRAAPGRRACPARVGRAAVRRAGPARTGV